MARALELRTRDFGVNCCSVFRRDSEKGGASVHETDGALNANIIVIDGDSAQTREPETFVGRIESDERVAVELALIQTADNHHMYFRTT